MVRICIVGGHSWEFEPCLWLRRYLPGCFFDPAGVFLLDGSWGDLFDPGLCSAALFSVLCFRYFSELSELSEPVQALNPQLLLVSQRLLCGAVQKVRCRFERAILAHQLNSEAIGVYDALDNIRYYMIPYFTRVYFITLYFLLPHMILCLFNV